MRYSASEKFEIIELVEQSSLSILSVVKVFEQRAGQMKALARLVDDVTRLAVGAASGVGRWSGV
jgi:hypothetical protein